MKWFKHDSNANTDTKLKKVKHQYGITGYGLYWYCVELIAESVSPKNITFELEEDAEIIALEWSLDQLKVQEIMQYMVSIGLFETGVNNQITCFKLAKRLDDTNSKNPQIKHILSSIESGNVGLTPSKSEKLRLDKIRLDKTKSDKKDKYATLAEELGVQVELIERIVKHRRDIKKPANTDKKIKLVITNFKSCVDQGFYQTLDQVMDKLDVEPWQTVKPEYLTGNNVASKHQPKSLAQKAQEFLDGE